MKYYRTTSHSKYDLKAHIVWVPKYRKKVLTGVIGQAIRDIIKQVCMTEDITIISGKLAPDHVHIFVSYPPHLSISKLVQKIKGKSSYKIMADFAHLRKTFWGKHFWGRGYMAVSSGNITDEVIKEYIESQEGENINQGSIEISD